MNYKIVKRRLKLYWEIIQAISAKHFVYVTDYSKLWFREFKESKSLLNGLNKEMWDLELEYIKPDMIICFGNAYSHLLEEKLFITKNRIPNSGYKYSDAVVLPLLHPSWNASKYRKDFFKVNEVEGNGSIAEKYITLIKKFLA